MKNLALIILIVALLAAVGLVWDLSARLGVATYDLAKKTARLDALEKSANLNPVAPRVADCEIDLPPSADNHGGKELKPVRRFSHQHYSIEYLALACAAGRLTHNGRIAILTGE